VKRRDAILALVALAAPAARAQGQRQAVIGLVSPGPPEVVRRNAENLVDGLRELGHVPGRTFRLEQRMWSGDPKVIDALFSDLLSAKPDVIVVGGLSLVRAAKQATGSIPIVVANASDLVASGIAQSYARPGGNLTGFTTLTDVLTGKRLEVLHEAVPTTRKVLLLQNPAQPQSKGVELHIRKLAAALRIELAVANATNERELEAALERLPEVRPDAVLVASHALFRYHAVHLIQRALKHDAAVVHWLPYAAQQGALLVQGVDDAKQHKRAATYVDRILKGARPGDLPIEQVASDELIINLKTAKTLGLKVSQTVLLRASKVIQ
jgi:putative ABC transport system substrate-binding protein